MAYTSAAGGAGVPDAPPPEPTDWIPPGPEPAPVPRPRHRGFWFAAASLTALVVFAPTAVRAYQWMVQQSASSYWSAQRPISALTVFVSNGDVSVTPGSASAESIDQTLHWDLHKPVVTERWTGDALTVSVDCGTSTPFAARVCDAELSVKVPPTTPVTVTTRNGKVHLEGMTGAVHAQTESGDIELTATGGTVWAHAISGTVGGDSLLSKQVDVGTSSGDVNLQFAAAPDRVVSSVISGETSILVPPGDGYLIVGRTISGQRDIDPVLENSTSEREIAADSASGDVVVHAES